MSDIKRSVEAQSFESINLLGLRIDVISLKQFINQVEYLLETSQTENYVVTPNSEFFVNAQADEEYKKAINNAAISITDGVFVQWATTFNKLPVTAKSIFAKNLQITWQYVYSGASIVLNPSFVKKIVNERLSGSQIIHDTTALAAKNGYKIALAGGYALSEKGARKGDNDLLDKYYHIPNLTTGKIAAEVLKNKYPGVKFVTDIPIKEDRTFPEDIVDRLKESDADILYFCGMPKQQEKWLRRNLKATRIKLAFGLGGSLDYASGIKNLPPKWMRMLGLEWFLRPILAEGLSKRTLGRIRRSWATGFFNSSMLVLKTKIAKNK
jgi:exopolysaccharide biosynthesis WecB/TagA/CpsF family protein